MRIEDLSVFGLELDPNPSTPKDQEGRPNILISRKVPLEYTIGQKEALLMIQDFMRSDDKYFLLAGFAGTGKTSIAENIIRYTYGSMLAPTNAAVMRLVEKMPYFRGNINTIHSTIYGTPNPETGAWKPKTIKRDATYIIDESSMIDIDVLTDLLKLSEVYNNKLIFIGDSFQLPPVGKDPQLFDWDLLYPSIFFSRNKTELTEVKRQDGEILNVATYIRESKKSHILHYNNDFKIANDILSTELTKHITNNDEFVIITSTNKKRMSFNSYVRSIKFPSNTFNVVNKGEVLISVGNNEKINGELFTLEEPSIVNEYLSRTVNIGSKKFPKMKTFNFYHIFDEVSQTNCLLIPDLDIPSLHGHQLVETFKDNELFVVEENRNKLRWNKNINIATYGYSLTAHKSQGNEFDNVYIDAEWLPDDIDDSRARWFYTAITRGKKKVRLKDSRYIRII